MTETSTSSRLIDEFRVPSAGAFLAVQHYGPAHDQPGDQPGDGSEPILFLPALGVPLGYYRPLFDSWAARGRHVFGAETRGMPLSPVDGRSSRTGYGVLVNDDIPALVAAVGERVSVPVVVVGHSLGGQVALLCAAADRITPTAVVAIASGSSSPLTVPTTRGRLRRRFEILIVRAAVRVLGYWPGHRLGFGGRQTGELMTDWAHEARFGGYRLAGDPTDYEGALGSLTVPALLVGIAGDDMITPRAMGHLVDRLPSTADTVLVPESPEHAHGHFAWARRDPEAVIAPVEAWLTGRHGDRP